MAFIVNMSAMSWSVAQSRAVSVRPSARSQPSFLLKPVSTQRRSAFTRRAPLRQQPIVRAEQKENNKDSKSEKDAEKLVKGV